jgi:hypothetical protein
MAFLHHRDPVYLSLIEALGLNPAVTRSVVIRFEPGALVRVDVETYLTDEQGKHLGGVISRHLYLAKLPEPDVYAFDRKPSRGYIDVTSLASHAREYVCRPGRWYVRLWRWVVNGFRRFSGNRET